MKKIKSIIKLLRVKQLITKNAFVFAGVIFAGEFTNINSLYLTFIAFLTFCFGAASIYVINDIMDRKADANHPVKCKRPIASGNVKVAEAIILAIILGGAAMALPIMIKAYYLLYCILAYVVMMILYSIKLKNVVIMDVMIIALGFLLRAVAGVLVIEVNLSVWLILCTGLLALFLALNKRRGELDKLGDSADTREVLKHYSKESLKEMLSVITPSLVVCFALYTVNSPAGPIMLITLPFVIYGVFRYIYITDTTKSHDAPDAVLLKDMPLLIDVLLWVIVSGVLIMYV